jgi:DNA-binding transcriptional MerR regulator
LKINEVETLVGITKKNIRFYEEEGLLCPQRDSGNGYRNYGQADVEVLRRIKLLRKLGLPLEEIRLLQSGRLTVADAMRRHQVALDREEENLHKARELCSRLETENLPLQEMDAGALLSEMEQMEKEGATFMDAQKKDVRKKYIAPVIVTVLVVAFVAGLIALVAWALTTDLPPKPVIMYLCLYLLAALGVVFGVIWCLRQRIKEIQGGEEDEARKY